MPTAISAIMQKSRYSKTTRALRVVDVKSVSHDLGANLSLMLFGLANGVNAIPKALSTERAT